MSTTKTRLYKVTTPRGIRLIESPNVARAIAHAARQEISAVIPAQHEVYQLARAGVEIELVGEEFSDESRSAVAQQPLEAQA